MTISVQKKINKKKLQVVTISFDFSMKIYGYTGFYLCRMPSAPLNLNNITLALSLFLSSFFAGYNAEK